MTATPKESMVVPKSTPEVHRILVVEDEPSIAESYRGILAPVDNPVAARRKKKKLMMAIASSVITR